MIEEFSKFASKNGYSVKILCARISKELPLSEKLDYAEIVRFPVPLTSIPLLGMNKDYIFLGFQVKKYFKNHPPSAEDVFIANGRGALGILNQKYVLRMVQPAFVFLKNMEIAKEYVSPITRIARAIHFTFQHFLEKKCAKNASGFIFSSYESKELAYKELGVKNKPFFIPHSGIKYDELQHGKKIRLSGRKVLFVSAGDEKIRKGIIYLEKVLPYIFDRYKDVHLLHVGKKIKWDIAEKYSNRILSFGNVPWDKMRDYYVSSDFVVSCALNEAIPNVVFEAMASGCPVLSSDTEGIREVIDHLKDGYIYKRGHIEDLKEGLCFMIENKLFRKKAGDSLRKKAKKTEYDLFSKNLIEFIERVNSGKKTNINLLR
jgi:glycosyltransferase involved in cell wall biosynthesis